MNHHFDLDEEKILQLQQAKDEERRLERNRIRDRKKRKRAKVKREREREQIRQELYRLGKPTAAERLERMR